MSTSKNFCSQKRMRWTEVVANVHISRRWTKLEKHRTVSHPMMMGQPWAKLQQPLTHTWCHSASNHSIFYTLLLKVGCQYWHMACKSIISYRQNFKMFSCDLLSFKLQCGQQVIWPQRWAVLMLPSPKVKVKGGQQVKCTETHSRKKNPEYNFMTTRSL